ncbi:hypothetical protein [Rhizobium sp. Root482]|jgi:hypothetical protein|uniref:hypothetical protein n=1 Tax=Rhizobium sp. Root482 TaxID=1736543 RepID=UPI0012E3E348|nr:hypothetical protein [Rhizobium sp. Root482]
MQKLRPASTLFFDQEMTGSSGRFDKGDRLPGGLNADDAATPVLSKQHIVAKMQRFSGRSQALRELR